MLDEARMYCITGGDETRRGVGIACKRMLDQVDERFTVLFLTCTIFVHDAEARIESNHVTNIILHTV